jgi:hypothetical protein
MYLDAKAAVQRVWNAINDARQNGVEIFTHMPPGNLVVIGVKGMQKVWLDYPSTVNFNSVVKSTTPAETQIPSPTS